ncbi:MAG: cytochrome c-550 PedF [Rhizobiaceae bacterium]|nr:cytochrome c-550 PedF [Rhizobiaceae bacterium]
MRYRNFTLGLICTAAISGLVINTDFVSAHGDVTPQAIDTSELPDIGEDWLEENPWRDPKSEAWATALKIGASGYNQNCARCHGLEVISGGLAPDLRYLEADIDGDEWYLERYQVGYTQNGITKMPAFGELLGQKAAWAIRTYIETRPDDGALDDHVEQLKEIRDKLQAIADAGTVSSSADDIANMKTAMQEIAATVETASGAPVADSAASRAVALLDGSEASAKNAAEALTIGLSAAQ